MQPTHDRNAPRRAVNLTLDSALVARARADGLNLSAIAEAAIGRAVAERAAARLHAEIARGVAEFEDYLTEYGSFADAVLASPGEHGAEERTDDADA